ncbi:MAG: SprT family zinc-dependent metalloprotease [Candidatus Thermoplasmatota archaeon]
MKQIKIGDTKIPYQIKTTQKRKKIALNINQQGQITVKTPPHKKQDEINQFLDKKKQWMLNKIKTIEKQKNQNKKKEFLSGEKLPYKGRNYRLKVIKTNIDKPKIKLQQGKFILKTPENKKHQKIYPQIRNQVKTWYKQKATQHLKKRIKKYSKQMGIKPQKTIIKELKNSWGEHKNKQIKINWRIIMAPVNIQDYIIVHELTHLKENKHNQKFWNKISTTLPDYKKRIKWLKTKGNQLYF